MSLSEPMRRPPDRPAVPRPARSRAGVLALGGLAALVTGLYGLTAFSGWEPGSPKRDEIPGSVRAAPGGYRTYQYWHSGYHGGK